MEVVNVIRITLQDIGCIGERMYRTAARVSMLLCGVGVVLCGNGRENPKSTTKSGWPVSL
jgi:hypothetical protein